VRAAAQQLSHEKGELQATTASFVSECWVGVGFKKKGAATSAIEGAPVLPDTSAAAKALFRG
jgi:hypothetical protein